MNIIHARLFQLKKKEIDLRVVKNKVANTYGDRKFEITLHKTHLKAFLVMLNNRRYKSRPFSRVDLHTRSCEGAMS